MGACSLGPLTMMNINLRLIKVQSVKNILLTGVTGVLGGRLLAEMLLSTEAVIYCLTRDSTYAVAEKRIRKVLELYIPDEQVLSLLRSRVEIVFGDVTKPYIGIKPDTYQELVEKIDLVFHSAASVKVLAPYNSLKPVNVDGTARIVAFCLAGKIPLAHVSSYTVLGDKIYEKDFVFYEDDLDVGQSFPLDEMNYERTKFEAENLIHRAGQDGLNYLIIRPGEIFGDSQTGAYPFGLTTVPGVFYDIFKSVIETGYAPFSDENFDITPVDYVAKAGLRLALTQDAYGKTFHLVNPVHRYFYEVINLLIDYGYRIRMLPYRHFVQIAKENKIIKNGQFYRSAFINIHAYAPENDLWELARFDTSLTREYLEGTGIHCPEADLKLFSRYLTYCITIGYLPSPEQQKSLAEIRM